MARVDTRNSSKYWQDLEICGLTLLCADFTTHKYAPHVHDAYVVAVTENGGAEFKSRGVIAQAEESALLVFNPAEPHSGWMGASNRWRYRSFYLTDKAMQTVAEGLDMAGAAYFCSNVFKDRELIGAFLRLHYAIESSESRFSIRSQLYTSFGKLIERHGSSSFSSEKPSHERVMADRVIAYLREYYMQDISLDELATLFGLAPFQMIRCFNRTVGLPPHTYLTQIRLQASCRLLKQGRSFVDAAIGAGFYDQSAFNKHFKRAYGITPRQFLAALTNARSISYRSNHLKKISPIPEARIEAP
jgi:AraC-like DNA-binding protein